MGIGCRNEVCNGKERRKSVLKTARPPGRPYASGACRSVK